MMGEAVYSTISTAVRLLPTTAFSHSTILSMARYLHSISNALPPFQNGYIAILHSPFFILHVYEMTHCERIMQIIQHRVKRVTQFVHSSRNDAEWYHSRVASIALQHMVWIRIAWLLMAPMVPPGAQCERRDFIKLLCATVAHILIILSASILSAARSVLF